MTHNHIDFEGERIPYTVVRTDRRTMAVQVRRDGSVVVRAPLKTRDSYIAQAIAPRAAWVARKRAEVIARASVAPRPAPGAREIAVARVEFSARVDRCWERFAAPGEARPLVRVRAMKSRWGSMSRAGRMSLNAHLADAPEGCLEYVIYHELCHMRVPNHSPRFYRELSRYVPDWKSRRAELARIAL